MKDHFKFAPDIFSRLGEELIPNPEQGIIELVRNSYDADAVNCTIELINTDVKGGSLKIIDDGVGMDAKSITNGWFLIGRSTKLKRKLTEKKRLPVGDKGLGRLAALRLGSLVILKTIPKNEPRKEYSLTIDWRNFEKARVIEDVPFHIDIKNTDKPHGTEIEIKNLHASLGEKAIQRLARALILLSEPFASRTSFRSKLIAHGFTSLEKRVRHAYFEDSEYYLKASLDNDGRAEAKLMDWRKNVLATAKHEDLSKGSYKASEVEFELWTFLLDSKTFSSRSVSIKEVRDWLSIVGGVHFYHRGLRVQPYGNKGHDWLEMNLSRAKSPEERPSTNTSIGRVIVNDPRNLLVQKTDRFGFIEK